MYNDKQIIKIFTFEQFHNKKYVGSTKIRVHNLIKHWDEASLYQYGDKPDALIFQKVYCTYDYKYPIHYPGIRILDICDLDWTATPDIHIKETLDGMDAIVVPTEALKKLIETMTDKPVRIIKDRFDISEFPAPKVHSGQTQTAVWFGYRHNAELLKTAMYSLEKRGLNLILISNEDPVAYKWTNAPSEYESKYKYIKFKQETLYENIKKADVCIMPKGSRPEDRFKSENKTVIAQLCGLPVVSDADGLDAMKEASARNEQVMQVYGKLKEDYDCRKSVEEYKELIKEIGKIRSDGN